MIALGIDPGLAETGWGLVERRRNRFSALDYGVIETPSSQPTGERLLAIHLRLREVLQRFEPRVCGVEILYFSRNVTSALPVAQARGVVLLTVRLSGIPVVELAPNLVKKNVVGIATAEKDQVMEMIRVILGLSERPRPSHAADALALAYSAILEGVPTDVP